MPNRILSTDSPLWARCASSSASAVTAPARPAHAHRHSARSQPRRHRRIRSPDEARCRTVRRLARSKAAKLAVLDHERLGHRFGYHRRHRRRHSWSNRRMQRRPARMVARLAGRTHTVFHRRLPWHIADASCPASRSVSVTVPPARCRSRLRRMSQQGEPMDKAVRLRHPGLWCHHR
jgi:hypothetical protein